MNKYILFIWLLICTLQTIYFVVVHLKHRLSWNEIQGTSSADIDMELEANEECGPVQLWGIAPRWQKQPLPAMANSPSVDIPALVNSLLTALLILVNIHSSIYLTTSPFLYTPTSIHRSIFTLFFFFAVAREIGCLCSKIE